MAKKRKLKNGAVSPEEFVRIWQSAGSLREVAERTGCDAAVLRVRAADYRKRGVPLKKFSGQHTPLDIPRLKPNACERRQLTMEDAAPDMLDALRHLVSANHHYSPAGCSGCDAARAAIAKAGEMP